MNHNYAKYHAFIKKLTIDVIFRWLYDISYVVSWPSPHFLSVEHCFPPPPPPVYQDPTNTDYVLYIHTPLI